ncbi:MAG: phosphoribosyltransferase [Candidatus Thorarchaeota archaeon]
MRFRDREDAGKALAALLKDYISQQDLNLLAIPNGGIPVGLAIQKNLPRNWTVSLLFVRKLQVPYNPEAGFGAVTLDGSLYLNHTLLSRLHLSDSEIKTSKKLALQSLERRFRKFEVEQQDKSLLKGRTAILVDDGLASGYTMLAAAHSIAGIALATIIAVPTASENAIQLIESKAKAKVLCPDVRSGPFFAVADAYAYWSDISDEEAVKAIRMSQKNKIRVSGF